jgi:WD40 repeat protein
MLVAVGCGRQYCNGLGIWDTDEGRLLRTLNMPRGGSSAASLSADGSLLAVGGDKDVYIYETTTGILQQKIQVNSSHILSLALSPDARKLVTGSSWWQPLELWSLDTGELIYTLSPEAAAENIILSRDGKVAVTNASEWVHIWQLSNGLMLKDLNMAQAVKPIPVIYRDNTFNASSDSQFTYRIGYQENGTYYIQLLDAITGDQLKILEGELKNRIWYSSFSPDQDLFAAGDEDGNVYVWDTKRGNLLYTLRHRNLSSMAFSPDGSILATGGSRTLKIINPNTGEIIKELYQSSEIIGILFSPDGKLLASTGWSEVQLWDITTLQQLFRFPGGGGRASFSPDSRLIAIRSYIYATRGYKQFISLWNVMNGELLHKFKGEDTYFTGGGPLQFSPDGQLFVATGMTDNIARIFEVETGKFVDLTLPVESSDFSFSSEGHFLIFNCEDGTVRVFGVK